MVQECFSSLSVFPLGLENLEKWEGIFQSRKSQGILNRLEKSENFRQMMFIAFQSYLNEMYILC